MNDPTRIYNCDESGLSGRPNHVNGTKNVIVPKHIRHPYQTQVNISGHITLLLAIFAAGQTPSTCIIFLEPCLGMTTQQVYQIHGFLKKLKADLQTVTYESTVPSNDEAQQGSSGKTQHKRPPQSKVQNGNPKNVLQPRGRKSEKCLKRSKAIIGDDNVLCIACMTNNQLFYWVGSDRCDYWVHYECLPSRVQTYVDLSLTTD
ncbi:unnamed protein product [Mytilus edulis]|uniref:Uncharacterized protein n=1 Tax=Mytilus edulis TaxID=6550 RepID=A0A8S3UV09_MYTED|nr:unnamed protein product [Mytilus edulis]